MPRSSKSSSYKIPANIGSLHIRSFLSNETLEYYSTSHSAMKWVALMIAALLLRSKTVRELGHNHGV